MKVLIMGNGYMNSDELIGLFAEALEVDMQTNFFVNIFIFIGI